MMSSPFNHDNMVKKGRNGAGWKKK